MFLGIPCGSASKESACNVGDLGSIPGLGRSPEERKGYPLQFSDLENFMDYTANGIIQARILEWVAFPFSRGSFQPRGRTQISHIVGGFFTSWATRETKEYWSGLAYPFSIGSFQPRNQTGVSCVAGRFLTNWAVREYNKKIQRYKE